MNYRQYDAIIVGSGFGGSAAAYVLSKAGLKTLLLERGEWAKRDDVDWNAREILINRRYKSKSPVYVNQDSRKSAQEVFLNEVVGGNSIFFGGAALRFRETDFERWPISYAELEPYYAEAEELLEVSGESNEDPFEPYRSSNFPSKVIPLSEPSERIYRASEALGFRPFRLPLAINFKNHKRVICICCNTCDGYPCKIEAKNDAATTLLKKAQEYHLAIMTGALVKSVNEENGTITSIEFIDKNTKKTHRISSKIVIISAGALQSPGILLRSRLEHYQHNRLIGKYLMRHCGAIVSFIFPFKTNPGNVFHKQVGITHFYEDFRSELNTSVGMIQDIYMPVSEVVKYYAPNGIKNIASFVAGHCQNLICIAEDEPCIDNAVSLSEQYDQDGIETIAVKHRYSNNDYLRRNYLVKHAKKILRKAGGIFSAVHSIDEHSPPTFSHVIGTVRFGTSPETSVLDRYCKFFGIHNLYVLDGSFMPTSAGINPSLTITANSLRVSDHIIRNFSTI